MMMMMMEDGYGLNTHMDDKILANTDFRIYPNPAKGKLTIDFIKADVYELFLMDSNGKILLEEKTDSPQHQLNVEMLPSGTYFLSIKSSEGEMVKRVVITH